MTENMFITKLEIYSLGYDHHLESWVDLAKHLAKNVPMGSLNENEFHSLLDDYYSAFYHVHEVFGKEIASAIFKVGSILPNEIVEAAQYLYQGGNALELVEQANKGKFEMGLVPNTYYKRLYEFISKEYPEIVEEFQNIQQERLDMLGKTGPGFNML